MAFGLLDKLTKSDFQYLVWVLSYKCSSEFPNLHIEYIWCPSDLCKTWSPMHDWYKIRSFCRELEALDCRVVSHSACIPSPYHRSAGYIWLSRTWDLWDLASLLLRIRSFARTLKEGMCAWSFVSLTLATQSCTNPSNKGLISADRSNKATLPLTIPSFIQVVCKGFNVPWYHCVIVMITWFWDQHKASPSRIQGIPRATSPAF